MLFVVLAPLALATPTFAATSLVTTVAVGDLPMGVAVNTATNRIYVANNNGGSVSVVDGASHTVVATIPTGQSTGSVAVDESRNLIYATSADLLHIIDGATSTVARTAGIPRVRGNGIGVNEVDGIAYVCSDPGLWAVSASGSVVAINPDLSCRNVAYDPQSNKIWAIDGTGGVYVISSETLAVESTINLPDLPSFAASAGIAINPGTHRVYVTRGAGIVNANGFVAVIDTSSRSILTTLEVGDDPAGVAVNLAANRIYVQSSDFPRPLHVIDGATNTIIETAFSPGIPVWVAVNEATQNVYVTDQIGDSLNVLHDADAAPPRSVPPQVSGVPDRAANAAGWYNGDVLVNWLADDAVPSSGTPSDPPDTLASTEGANVVYTSAPSCDPANNCATGSISLSIDKTDPSVGVPVLSLNPISVSEAALVSVSAADSLSGVAGGEYFLDTDPGEGNGVAMSFAAGSLSASIGSLGTGVYSVCVRSRDAADNWGVPSCAFLVVYDPSAGFATGGGWFVPGGSTSDAGDLLPGLDGTSKANFGFVVKYQNGSSTVPGGSLEFHYNVGKFHLRSTGMDWLVVTNQNWAKFKGSARIDGASGEYPFRVDARDDTVDRFVIRIWAPGANPDTDAPIYKASGDVEGGQVKIHRS